MPFVEVDGARIAASTSGAGPDLVLIHAGVADQRMWEPLVDRVADRFRVTRYDLREFGATEYGPEPFSHRRDLEQLLAALQIERPTLVGASYGGQVALDAAGLASRLVLLDTALPDHDWSERIRAFGAAEDAALEAGDVGLAVEVNVEMWAGPDAANQALVREMQARAFELQLAAEPEQEPFDIRPAEIAIPVDVVYGERDVEDFIAIARRLADEIPDAKLHAIPDAGHLPALEQPDAVAALL